MAECFIITGGASRAWWGGNPEFAPGLQCVDLDPIPERAPFMYMSGFEYFALLPPAAQLFKKLSTDRLEALIALKERTYPEDVPILKKALELKRKEQKAESRE